MSEEKSAPEEEITTTPEGEGMEAPGGDEKPVEDQVEAVEVEVVEEAPEDESMQLKKRIEELERQVKEEKDNALRHQAEMVNFRKRQEKERSTWTQSSVREIISSFLDPLDNLERTVEAASQDGEGDEKLKSLTEGVKMVMHQFDEAFKKRNVVCIDPKGDLFNPNEHEAYGQLETDEVEEGHVCAVFRKGYRIGEQLIRTATVQVAKKPSGD